MYVGLIAVQEINLQELLSLKKAFYNFESRDQFHLLSKSF